VGWDDSNCSIQSPYTGLNFDEIVDIFKGLRALKPLRNAIGDADQLFLQFIASVL
jgi:hypothetical protein